MKKIYYDIVFLIVVLSVIFHQIGMYNLGTKVSEQREIMQIAKAELEQTIGDNTTRIQKEIELNEKTLKTSIKNVQKNLQTEITNTDERIKTTRTTLELAIADTNKRIKKDIDISDYQHLKRCSVIVKVGNKENRLKKLGSGVITEQDEKYLYILTVKHVINNKKYAEVKLITSNDVKITVPVEIENIYTLEDQDLAIIKVLKPEEHEFETAPISKRYPVISDKVYVVGHPIGIKYTLGEGRVSNFMKYKDKKWLMVSAHAIFGNSGSPIFNDNYEVIGILSGGNGIYDKHSRQYIYLLYMTRAVKTEHLHKLLNEVMED